MRKKRPGVRRSRVNGLICCYGVSGQKYSTPAASVESDACSGAEGLVEVVGGGGGGTALFEGEAAGGAAAGGAGCSAAGPHGTCVITNRGTRQV